MRERLTRLLLPVGIVFGAIWLISRAIDLRLVTGALRQANWAMVVGAGILAATFCMGGIILRLHTLLAALPHRAPIDLAELTSIHFASSAAHNVLPAPAGEVLRTMQLNRRHGYAVGALIGAQVVEKVVEALGLSLGTLAIAAMGRLPRALSGSMVAVAALGVGGTAVVLVLGHRWRPATRLEAAPRAPGILGALRAHARGLLRHLGDTMHQLRAPSVWRRAVAWSLLSDLVNAVTVGLCLLAVGVSLPLPAWFLVMLVTRVVALAPSTPGQFGVQEGGMVLVLGLLGVEQHLALAVALLYRVTHFVPVTLIGLTQMRRQWTPRPVSP